MFEGGSPATISPDGATVAANAFGGRAQAALWDVTRPRHPVRLAVLSAGLSGALWGEAFSPGGRILAVASTTGLVLWDVADPARATRMATPAGPGDYFAALAFSPRENLLAGVTYHGSMLVFRVAG